MRGLRFAAAAALTLACGCVAPDGTWVEDAAIFGGQATSDYKSAVAYAVEDPDIPGMYYFSSGVLIGRRTVLVSAYSASSPTDHAVVYFGSAYSENGTIKTVSEHVIHPDYVVGSTAFNVAIAVLDGASDLEPAIPNPTPLDDSWIGEPLTLVGMGTDDPYYTDELTEFTKRATTVTLDSLSEDLLFHYSPGHNACQGDLGAPLYAHVDGEERVVAVVSDDWSPHGGNPCAEGGGADVRIAPLYDWLEPYIDLPDEENPWDSEDTENPWCSCSAPGEGPMPWRLGVLCCGLWLAARRLRAPARR